MDDHELRTRLSQLGIGIALNETKDGIVLTGATDTELSPDDGVVCRELPVLPVVGREKGAEHVLPHDVDRTLRVLVAQGEVVGPPVAVLARLLAEDPVVVAHRLEGQDAPRVAHLPAQELAELAPVGPHVQHAGDLVSLEQRGQVVAQRQVAQAPGGDDVIAETLRRANRYPLDMAHLGYYILAPQTQIAKGRFAEALNREALRQKVKQRIDEYGKGKKQWYKEWFEPTMEQLVIRAISWEAIFDQIEVYDTAAGQALKAFFNRCVTFN